MDAQQFLSGKIEAEADRLFQQEKDGVTNRLREVLKVFEVYRDRYTSAKSLCEDIAEICAFNRVEHLQAHSRLQQRYYEQAFKNIQGEK